MDDLDDMFKPTPAAAPAVASSARPTPTGFDSTRSSGLGAAETPATAPESETRLYDNLRQLITVVDELRDVGLHQYIDLPRIVAIGSQSSGKSSVIESIAGYDFLPRGEGLCTRRPLELRMKHLNVAEYPEGTAYATFERTKKRFTDFDQVRAEIERETDLVAGTNKNIVDDPIKLEICSTNAPDLTLIDLPGITRVPLRGSDQRDDIEKVTKDMTNKYIRDQRTIILAVLPANQDMSTADSLDLARQADPQGLRTIGVITKIDLMDHGTDAMKMLKGDTIELNLGFVGVKLRSQQAINQKQRIRMALQSEKEWFQAHRLYSKLPPGLTGIPCLIEKLTKVLFRHIRDFLPEIKREIAVRHREVKLRLDELGEGVPLEDRERVQLVWSLINDYTECFRSTIRGRYDRKLQRYIGNIHDVNGGARIRRIFNEFLIDYHYRSITEEMDDREIDRALRMHEGDSLPGFGNTGTFMYLILPQIKKIKLPAAECVNDVNNALDSICQKIARSVFNRFPKLAERALHTTQEICFECKTKALEVADAIVDAEVGYLFTNDDEYLVELGSMGSMAASQPEQQQQQQEAVPEDSDDAQSRIKMMGRYIGDKAGTAKKAVGNFFTDPNDLRKPTRHQENQQNYHRAYVNEIRKRLDAYFRLGIRNVRDSIPKAIGWFLVRALEDRLQFELFTQITQNSEALALMLGEPPHITDERKSLAHQAETLKKAADVLQKDPKIASLVLDAGSAGGNAGAGGSSPMRRPLPTAQDNFQFGGANGGGRAGGPPPAPHHLPQMAPPQLNGMSGQPPVRRGNLFDDY